MTVWLALAVGILGLVLTAALLLRDHDRRFRRAGAIGAMLGFLLAFAVALALDKDALTALAIAAIGATVLALVLIGQWRLFRVLFAKQGHRL